MGEPRPGGLGCAVALSGPNNVYGLAAAPVFGALCVALCLAPHCAQQVPGNCPGKARLSRTVLQGWHCLGDRHLVALSAGEATLVSGALTAL